MEFSKEFLKREVREGFEIDEMMKRAWAAQMEVLLVNRAGKQILTTVQELLPYSFQKFPQQAE